MKTPLTQTTRIARRSDLLAACWFALAALMPGCGSGIADKYNVRLGLRADVSDEARDPNSVSMLEPTTEKSKRLQKPVEEILTTEGMDEALDDDMDNISPVAEATTQEKTKATSDLVAPTQK